MNETVTDSSSAALGETQVVARRPDTSAIPSLATDDVREPNVVLQRRGYVLGAVGLLLLQTGLIAGLWIHRRHRLAAERALRESEERSRVIAESAPDAEESLPANEAALRQRHAEIEDLPGRLIAAQEAERARMARKLHDDISQRLAVISIGISECQQSERRAGSELLEALSAVQQQTIALAEDVRLLSHDLYPGALDHADLADALRTHCREFAQEHSLNAVVDADEDLVIPDVTISLSLYRVVQEALRNIAKHAHARQVQVTLRRVEEGVQLVVADDGKGFILAKARPAGGGLGLRTIEERIRFVGGRLSIETAPDMGTTIRVWVKDVTTTAPCAGVAV